MRRGIVMELGDRYAIVLTESGAFERVPKKGRQIAVGEEISLPAARRGVPRRAFYSLTSTVAAALIFAVFIFAMLPGGAPPVEAKPVAYVSIDINPSVELGIEQAGTVVQISGKNEGAVELLEGLALIGLPIEQAVAQVMEQAERKLLKDRAEADIVITSVVMDETVAMEETKLQAQVQAEVDRVIRQYHADTVEQYRVTVWSAPKEVLEEASSAGLSAGKMTFYLKAKASGVEVTTGELQKETIHDVAKRFEDKQLLAEDPTFTKEAMKELLKQVIAAKKALEKGQDDDADDDDGDDDRDEDRGKNEDDKNDKGNGNGNGKGNGNGNGVSLGKADKEEDKEDKDKEDKDKEDKDKEDKDKEGSEPKGRKDDKDADDQDDGDDDRDDEQKNRRENEDRDDDGDDKVTREERDKDDERDDNRNENEGNIREWKEDREKEKNKEKNNGKGNATDKQDEEANRCSERGPGKHTGSALPRSTHSKEKDTSC